MSDQLYEEAKDQLTRSVNVLRHILKKDLLGVYLYGSSIVGGLHKFSDLDLFIVSNRMMSYPEKSKLIADLLEISDIYKQGPKRPIEMTIVVKSQINPWHYPPNFDFQYGEWLRKEFENENYEPWQTKEMPDLALLITQVLLASETLFGPNPAELLSEVPYRDVVLAMTEALDNAIPDLNWDTFNVLLTLARIWSTLETEEIRSKVSAANWAIDRLPELYQLVMRRAKAVYSGEESDCWDDMDGLVESCAKFIVNECRSRVSLLKLSGCTSVHQTQNDHRKLEGQKKMNDKHKLGLPFEYQQMPEYFDAHNVSEETETKNALIEKLLKEQRVNTVLDMTCGTGSQVFYLAERGYKMVGSDFSPALIKIARNKANKIGKNITFIDGDMRELRIGKFDAVITIFNAVGHLVKEDFEKALQNIYANLKDGGVYIFDIFNLQAITEDVIDGFAMDLESIVEGVKIRNVQHSEIDRKNGFLTSHDHYTVSKDGYEPETHINNFSLQIYTAKELQEILARNGFEAIHQYDMEGNDFVADKSLNILTLAKKIKV